MKNKKTLLIFVLAFIVLLAGASILYNSLSKNMNTNQLLSQEENQTSTSSENETGSETTNSETTDSETDSETANSETTDSETGSETTNSETADSETDSVANPAPDFTVTDISGAEVKLSDFIGKPVILNFWASWCGPCKSEMPDFNEAYNEYKDDISFLMVNLTDGSRETVDIASSYIMEQGYTFPVYYDTLSKASITYAVYSVPTTYFIDAEGNLIAQAQGAIDRETLQTGIDMIYSAE